MYFALALFILTYALLLALPNHRVYVALCSAAIFVIIGILPFNQLLTSVDWNVIMMIAGTMGIVYFFIKSHMPALMADVIIDKMPNVKWAILSLALLAGIISAFVDNVATVLMVAPVALTIAKKLKISPVSSIIAIAISSNVQGAATLVGDTTSILLGSYAKLNFLDFFFYKGKPGMFWVVEISALVSSLVLLYIFRKDKQKIKLTEKTKVTDYFPSILLLSTILLLILASFVSGMPAMINGFICMGLFMTGIIRELFVTKDFKTALKPIKEIDYFTLLLLTGLFVVIAGITEAGVVDEIAKLFIMISGNNVFIVYTLIVWASVFLSAFIDNIPYIATMLPVVTSISAMLVSIAGMKDSSVLLYFGLLSGATLGGNLTPVGASANISALGILRKEGYEVGVGQFMKISVPFTLSAAMIGYVMIWLIWSGGV
jgi:Na+/H+ antiporter NhaD/arsenite permease-like protein